jgi:hypothetical protein
MANYSRDSSTGRDNVTPIKREAAGGGRRFAHNWA